MRFLNSLGLVLEFLPLSLIDYLTIYFLLIVSQIYEIILN